MDDRMYYIDCGSGFHNATDVSTELTVDGLHPNAWGYEILASCLQPLVDELMALPFAQSPRPQLDILGMKNAAPGSSAPQPGGTSLLLDSFHAHRALQDASMAAAPQAARKVLKDISDTYADTCANGSTPVVTAEDDAFAERMAASAALNVHAPDPDFLVW